MNYEERIKLIEALTEILKFSAESTAFDAVRKACLEKLEKLIKEI